jgi:hypothetical protein
MRPAGRLECSGTVSTLPSRADLGIPAHARDDVRTVTEDLPGQILNGIAVKGSRVTSTVPPGVFGNDREIKIVTEPWFPATCKCW